MSFQVTAQHLAILCHSDGTICQVFHDGLSITDQQAIGTPFGALIDPTCHDKADSLLAELWHERLVIGWELLVLADNQSLRLYFAGIRFQDTLLLVAATHHLELLKCFVKVMSTEQMHLVAERLGEQVIPSAEPGQNEREIYNELSRLNNELLTAQRELFQTNLTLRRLLRQKNELLGIAAHDLRNPLSGMKIYAKLLLEDRHEPLTDGQRELVTAIYEHSDSLFQLINSLLSISRIEAGRLDLVYEHTDVRKLIERTVTLNRLFAHRKQMQIEFECDDELPQAQVDAGKIQQVLDNLLSNAIKFSYPHTVIHVRALGEPDHILISVQDQGQGIPAEELDRLFLPFAKVSVKPTAGEPSSQLGLAITHKIVRGHQGEIWVESETGQGSTFYVRLPLLPARSANSRSSP